LGFQFSQRFFLITVNNRATPDDSLAGIESPVRAGCNRTASQVVQLLDYLTLNGRSNLQKEVTISSRLGVLTEPTALRRALSRTNGESFETGYRCPPTGQQTTCIVAIHSFAVFAD